MRRQCGLELVLVRMLCEAVDSAYTAVVKKEHTGYTGMTALELLTHLFGTYKNIDKHDLQENAKRQVDPSY